MKKFSKISIILASIIGVVLCVSFFVGYFTLNQKLPSAQQFTQKEVFDLTAYDAKDSIYTQQLKNNALNAYLSTGSDKLVTQLDENIKLLNNLDSGQLPENQLSTAQTTLQDKLGFSSKQVTEIIFGYQVAKLKNNLTQLETMNQSLSVTDLPAYGNLLNNVVEGTNIVISDYEKNLDSPYMPLILQSDDALNQSNQILAEFSNYINIVKNYENETPDVMSQINLQNPLIMNFQSTTDKLDKALETKQTVENQMTQLQDFQKNWEKLTELSKNAIPLQNLVGMTLKEAKAALSPDLKLKVADNNSDSDKAVILSQSPDAALYEKILKGQTITVTTKSPLTDNQTLLAKALIAVYGVSQAKQIIGSQHPSLSMTTDFVIPGDQSNPVHKISGTVYTIAYGNQKLIFQQNSDTQITVYQAIPQNTTWWSDAPTDADANDQVIQDALTKTKNYDLSAVSADQIDQAAATLENGGN